MGSAALFAVLLATGCATTTYRPPVPLHARTGQQIAVDGALLSLAAERWQYPPSNLDQVVTPVGVIIRNERQQPIPIAYKDFRLLTAQGMQLAALTPADVAQYYAAQSAQQFTSSAVPVGLRVRPIRHHFFLHHGHYYPYYDPFYYQPYWYEKPGNEVTVRGMQPGLVQPGATVTGFLYFQRIEAKTGTIKLEWDVRRLDTGLSQTLSLDVPVAETES